MHLNIKKSSVVWFHTTSLTSFALQDIDIDGTQLNTVKRQKYVGITYDDSLKRAHHISVVYKQPSFYLFSVNFHQHNLLNKVIKMLVNCLILSRTNITLYHYYMLEM